MNVYYHYILNVYRTVWGEKLTDQTPKNYLQYRSTYFRKHKRQVNTSIMVICVKAGYMFQRCQGKQFLQSCLENYLKTTCKLGTFNKASHENIVHICKLIRHSHHDITTTLKKTVKCVFCVRPSSRKHTGTCHLQKIIHLEQTKVQNGHQNILQFILYKQYSYIN